MRNFKTHAALAALIPLSLLLTPCGSVGQVTIDERVEIRKSVSTTGSAAANQGDSGFIAFLDTVAISKSTGTREVDECDPYYEETYIPCLGIPWSISFYCPCGPSCPAGPYSVVIGLATEPVGEQTFTWIDGTTGSKSTSSVTQFGEPGDLKLVSAGIPLVDHTSWGVATFSGEMFVDGESFCTGSSESPTDNDDDLIADPWEMRSENGGTLNLNAGTGSTDPACLALGAKDACWDEEGSDRNDNDGDGISKYREYTGVEIGGIHQRLSPERKEMFLDTEETIEGAFLAQEIDTQLDLNVIQVDGLKVDGIEVFPGSEQLEYSDAREEYQLKKNYIKISHAGVPYPGVDPSPEDDAVNGRIVVSGVYLYGGVSVFCPTAPLCQTGPPRSVKMGGTPKWDQVRIKPGDAAGVKVYDGTLANLWSASVNTIPEYAEAHFKFPVLVDTGIVHFIATFDYTDIDGSGDVEQFLNPLDILGYGLYNNDDLDGKVLDESLLAVRKKIALHEIGHALGIARESACRRADCHPESGFSVMRSGIGPGLAGTFSADDIMQMELTER